MKRIYLFFISFIMFSNLLSSQEIGLRFGEMTGNNVAIEGAISWQETRIHSNISFGDTVGIDFVFNFVFLPVFEIDNFYYYLGIGITSIFGNNFYLGGLGEVGVEYRFVNSPIALGLDYKPAVLVLPKTDYVWTNIGFNIRYVFN